MADPYYNMRYVATTSTDKSCPCLIKKAMANIPMSHNTKKSIDEYYKNAMKEIVMKIKAVEKAKKVKEKIVKKPTVKEKIVKKPTVKETEKIGGGEEELDNINNIISLFIDFDKVVDNALYKENENTLVGLLSLIQEIKDEIDKDAILNSRGINYTTVVSILFYRNRIYGALIKHIKHMYIIIAKRYPGELKIYKRGQLYLKIYKGQELYEGGHVYDGILNNDKREGKGKMTYANGDVYDGNWKDDKKEGDGKMTYANGDVYDGNWKDDKKEGKGKMTFKNGKRFIETSKKNSFYIKNAGAGKTDDIYEGNWENDKMNGEGKFTKSPGPGLYIDQDGEHLISERNQWTVEGNFNNNMAIHGTLIDGTLIDGGNKYEDINFVEIDILTLEKPPDVIPVAIKTTINTKGTNENPQYEEYLKRRNQTNENMKNEDRQIEHEKHMLFDNVRNRAMPINTTSPFSTTGVGSA